MISDLISELNSEFSVLSVQTKPKRKGMRFGLEHEEYIVSTDRQARIFGKDKGRYTQLFFRDFLNESNHFEYYQHELEKVLKGYLGEVKKGDTILVVGLGNRHISADSLGVEVVRNLVVTRSLSKKLPQICAFSPSVLGLTGIETADTIEAVVGKIKPNIVIFVDSLCASHSIRLGKSFQVSDTVVVPGEGVDNARKKVRILSAKIISIGVPLVIYSNTFFKSILGDAGLNLDEIDRNGKLNSVLSVSENELVTLKDIQSVVKSAGRLIAFALNKVVLGVEKL